METTIIKTVKAKYMLELFEMRDKINIKYFQAHNYIYGDDDCEVIYTYDIVIRHNEKQDAEKLFNKLLKYVKSL